MNILIPMSKLIFVTGGNGRFAQVLKKENTLLNLKFLSKKEFNILNLKSIEKSVIKYKPKIIIHTAGLSRPMEQHEKNISKSIDLNIIGTANVVKICRKYNIKIIYFSTNYVYDCIKGNFKETDGIKPINNYGLSKMGGEASVLMYKNSLVLRIQMTEKPFAYNKAFTNVYSNYMFHEELVKILPKLIKNFGIINVGGKARSSYDFAKLYNKNTLKSRNTNKKIYSNQTMNLSKLKKTLK
ncbi:sugar nucleotide-binding protein [Candidatus Pelagibacter sp.]|nr:sugar nucleotide-binding protein [Candidatus Pelagibacter sp.]